MTDYVIWGNKEVPHALVLDQLRGVERASDLRVGIPRAASFPSDAVYTADPEFPNDKTLLDAFNNTDALVVISQPLKEFIESFHPPEVEFLPLTLLDHKSRPAGRYFILHPVHPVDALDPAASEAGFSVLIETWIDEVKRLVLFEDKLDRLRLLFKLKGYYHCVLIRRDLAEAITKKGFTGIKWVECEDYKSI